mmetsp:Transcript_8224/g.12498  ORF Transcript_8224/g.12498 Transcript_8224/m.12498 type:complete len:112 (+) Transcript_8224:917-1252(+)
MEVGQVSFHSERERRLFKVNTDREIVRSLMKTQKEKYPDLEKQKLRRDKEQQKRKKQFARQKAKEAAEKRREAEIQKKIMSYDDMFNDDDLAMTNQDLIGVTYEEFEDDFM